MDQGEEQLDYEDEHHSNANANGAIPTRLTHQQDDDDDDDDYDDLYQDVNVGFIRPHTLNPPPQPQPQPLHVAPPLPLSSSAPAPPDEDTPRFKGLELGPRAGGESTSGHHRGGGATSSATSTPRGTIAESGGGGGSVFVGELQWWTTDADLESALSEYGRVKEIAFFQERASGKSKGFCQVHFYDSAAARACKEGMNGRVLNGRACVVAFKSPRSLRHMSDSNVKDSNKRLSNEGASGPTRGPGAYDGGRNNYGRSGRGSSQGRGLGQGRGGRGSKGGGHYGQGLLAQPLPGGLMAPLGNQGFEASFGRGASGWPSFGGMVAQYPIPLGGVAPHVNPAFFNRGMGGNGMGIMASANTNSPGMDSTMWTDWGPDRRGADSSHGDDGSGYGSYGYGDKIHDRGGAGGRSYSNASSREWIGNTPEKRLRDKDVVDWERERYRDKERSLYRDQRSSWDKDEEYERERDRERVSARPRSKSRALEEEDPHSHPSRPLSEYGKRRR